jgi:hypothetical protein
MKNMLKVCKNIVEEKEPEISYIKSVHPEKE